MRTLTDGAFLLAAIFADHADDLARLAYADALEEDGQAERAEWIRYDIRYPHAGFSELVRGDALPLLGLEPVASVHVGNPLSFSAGLDDDWRAWMWCESDELGCVVSDLGRGMDYHTDRGMIDAVLCPLAAWLAHGPALVRAHPIERVELTDREPLKLPPDWWRWFAQGHVVPERHTLPAAMARAAGGVAWADFPSREAADAAPLAWAKLPEGER